MKQYVKWEMLQLPPTKVIRKKTSLSMFFIIRTQGVWG